MITVDDRIGAKELVPYMPRHLVEVRRLDYGDACMQGNGAGGMPVCIGVERKRIRDLVNSMTSGRLSGHQLIGLCNTYHVVVLVVEGRYRQAGNGVLEVWCGRDAGWQILAQGRHTHMFRDIMAFLHTLSNVAGIKVWHTADVAETAAYIASMHYWWTAKEWEEHRSHTDPYDAYTGKVPLHKPSVKRMVAMQLASGIGWERAGAADLAFDSVRDMVNADMAAWESVAGIGPTLAARIVDNVTHTNGGKR